MTSGTRNELPAIIDVEASGFGKGATPLKSVSFCRMENLLHINPNRLPAGQAGTRRRNSSPCSCALLFEKGKGGSNGC